MTKYENFGKFKLSWWQRFVGSNRRNKGIYRFNQRGAICHRFDSISDLTGVYQRCIERRKNATIKFSGTKKSITFNANGEVVINKGGCISCPYQ